MVDNEHEQLSRQTGMVLRTGIQVAMQVAEALARRREQNFRAAAATNEARTRALSARMAAERRSVEAYLARLRDPQWIHTADDAHIVDAVRVAHTWKGTSPVADRAVVTLEEGLRREKNIEVAGLRDTLDTVVVAAAVERDLAARAERERLADEYAARGHNLSFEAPQGPGYIPARYLATVEGAEYGAHLIDAETIAAHPQAWTVHVAGGPGGHPNAQFYCTDLDAAGVHRRPPTTPDMWDPQFIDSADVTQLRQVRSMLHDSVAVDALPRLDKDALDRRGLDLSRPADEVGRTITDAMPWAEKAVPTDVARYRNDDPKTKAAAEEKILLAFDTHHARQWANDQAPALAVAFAEASGQPDRQTYLDARDVLIGQWNAAGRPAALAPTELGSETAPPAETDPATPNLGASIAGTEAGWDTRARRDRDSAALTAAGVDPEAVEAHMLADVANASPLDATTLRVPENTPRASAGDRSANIEHGRGYDGR